uniref:Uncharacterized protein n=1 Tax=Tolypothrix bouteillei VB521301 TaxID=1479485 RepID=A0A0C1NA89_9CYAN
MQKIDELLKISENDLSIELSTGNLKLSESQVNLDNDLAAIAVNNISEERENDLEVLRTSVASKGAEAKAIFTQNQATFASMMAYCKGNSGRSIPGL